jgi:hypothetical protein
MAGLPPILALVSASPKVQMVLASGTVSQRPMPRKRMKESRSLKRYSVRLDFEGAFPFPRALLRLKAWANQRKNRRTSGECDYFFAPELVPGFPFKNEGDGAEGFGFSALGFFGSRLLRF